MSEWEYDAQRVAGILSNATAPQPPQEPTPQPEPVPTPAPVEVKTEAPPPAAQPTYTTEETTRPPSVIPGVRSVQTATPPEPEAMAPSQPVEEEEEEKAKAVAAPTSPTPAAIPGVQVQAQAPAPTEDEGEARIKKILAGQQVSGGGEEHSFLDEMGRSAARGAFAFARMPKQLLSILGAKTQATEEAAQWAEGKEAEYAPSESVSKSLADVPSLALNPQWWAANAPSLVVQVVPMIIAGILAGPEAAAGLTVAKAVQYGGGALLGITDAAQRMIDYDKMHPMEGEIPVLKRISIGLGAGLAGMVLPGKTMSKIMGAEALDATGKVIQKAGVLNEPIERVLTKVFGGPSGKKVADYAVAMTLSSGSLAGFSVIQNAFERYGYNADKQLSQGVLESLVLGLAMGGMEKEVGKLKTKQAIEAWKARQEEAKRQAEQAKYQEYKDTGKEEQYAGTQFTVPNEEKLRADQQAGFYADYPGFVPQETAPPTGEFSKTPETVKPIPETATPKEDLQNAIFGPSVNGGSRLADVMLDERAGTRSRVELLNQLTAITGDWRKSERYMELYNNGDYATALREFPTFASKEQRTFGRSEEGGNALGDIVQSNRPEADKVRQLQVAIGDEAGQRFYDLWKQGAVDAAYQEFHKEITKAQPQTEVPSQAVGPNGEKPEGPVPMTPQGFAPEVEHDAALQGKQEPVAPPTSEATVMPTGETPADAVYPETGVGKQDATQKEMLDTIRKIGEGANTKAELQDAIQGKQSEGLSRLDYLNLRREARNEVERRLQNGEAVEPDVLQKFPDLAQKYGETLPPKEGGISLDEFSRMAYQGLHDRISEVDEHLQALKDMGRTGSADFTALNRERVDLLNELRSKIEEGGVPLSGLGHPLQEIPKAPTALGTKPKPLMPKISQEPEGGQYRVDGVDGRFNSQVEANEVARIVATQKALADPEVMMSVNTLEQWAKKALATAGKKGLDASSITENIEALRKIGQVFMGRPDLLPPEDLTKSPIRSNADYLRTVDFDTNCPKRDLYAAIIDEVETRLQRLMTSDELFGLALKLQAEGLEAPCLYCYVEGGRRAFNEGVWKWLESDRATHITDPIAWMDRFRQWWKAKNDPNFEFPVSAEEAKEFDAVRGYAQASSMANLPKPYAPYRGQILNWSFQKTLATINERAGMRYQSNNDFRIQFVLDYMQSVVDLAMLKSKAHAYTKQPDFARIFGDTNMRIAQSLFCKDGPNGTFVEDVQNGMPWEAAKENMRRFPKNVGTIMVTTNDAQTLWAMKQDWIEQVIPFHRSGMTKEQFNSLNFDDYTATQTEKWIKPKDHVKQKPPHFDWDAHENNREKYLKLCEEAGVYPRFREWVNEDGYMKVITDFVKLDVPQEPLQAKFDYAYTEEALRAWQEAGGPGVKPPEVNQEFINNFVNKINNNDAMFRIGESMQMEGLEPQGRDYERGTVDQAGVPRWEELPLLSTPDEGGRFFNALREWAKDRGGPRAESVWGEVGYSEALANHPFIGELHQRLVDMGYHDIKIIPMEGMPVDGVLGGIMTEADGSQFFLLNDRIPERQMRKIADHEIFHKRAKSNDPVANALKALVDPLSPVTIKIGRMLNAAREKIGHRSLTASGVAEEICADLSAGINRFFTEDEVLNPLHAFKNIGKAERLLERYHQEVPTATPEQMQLLDMYNNQEWKNTFQKGMEQLRPQNEAGQDQSRFKTAAGEMTPEEKDVFDKAIAQMEKRWPVGLSDLLKGPDAEAGKREALDKAIDILSERWPVSMNDLLAGRTEEAAKNEAFDSAIKVLEKRWPGKTVEELLGGDSRAKELYNQAFKLADNPVTGKIVGDVKKAQEVATDIKGNFTRLLNSARISVQGNEAHQVIVGKAAFSDLEIKRITNALRQYAEQVGPITGEDSKAFCNLYKAGAFDPDSPNYGRVTNPIFKAFGEQFREIEREQYRVMKEMKVAPNELANYFDQLWVNDDKYKQVMNDLYKSLNGPTYFLNARKIISIPEGIAMGLTPKYENLADMAIAGRSAHQKYIGNQMIIQELRNRGWEKVVNSRTEAPEGWIKYPGTYGDVYVSKGEGEAQTWRKVGERYGPEDVVTQVANWLDKGLEGNTAYELYQSGLNAVRSLQMAGSGFHVIVETFNSMSNAAGLGFSDALGGLVTGDMGRLASGVKKLATSPLAMPQDVRMGLKISKALMNPEWAKTNDPMTLQVAEALVGGGMRIQVETQLSKIMAKHFVEAWKDVWAGKPFGAAGKALQGFASIIMDYIVPFSKNGAAFRQYTHEVANWERANPGKVMDNATSMKIAYEIRENADNLFGKMTMDNVGMNGTIRSLLSAVIQYPTWNIGTARLYSRALLGAKDALMKGVDIATGKEMRTLELKDRIALEHVGGLLLMVGLFGGLTNWALTGKKPETLEDYYFPRTGELKSNGSPERIQFPTYLKDTMGLTHHPLEVVSSKLAAPVHIMADLMTNKDYWGNQIYDPHDWVGQKVFDAAKFMGKSSMPFSLAGYQQVANKTPAMTAMAALGARPLSRQYTNTPAQQYMDEMAQLKRGTGTKADAEKSNLKSELYNMARIGDTGGFNSGLKEAVKAGTLSAEEAKQMVKNAQLNPMEIHLKGMSLEQALKTWDLADAQEKKILAETMVKKISSAKPEKRGDLSEQLFPVLKELRQVRKIRSEADDALQKVQEAQRETRAGRTKVFPLFKPSHAIE